MHDERLTRQPHLAVVRPVGEAVRAGEMAYTVLQPVAVFSEEAVRQADNFIELDELREVIGRPPREQQAERNFEVANGN